jgi:alpha-1,2-mannosyltransferase
LREASAQLSQPPNHILPVWLALVCDRINSDSRIKLQYHDGLRESRITTRPWLTAKRLRAHGFILALSLWSIYIWNISAPGLLDRAGNLKGTDFVHLYTLGSVALEHRGADLYNMKAQAELAAQRVPVTTGIRYLPLYPPQVSVFFGPIARFSYSRMLIVWLAVSALLYGLCVYFVWRSCPALQPEKVGFLVLAMAFPGFFHLIVWGQSSAVALVCFTLAYFALRKEKEFLAGLALGTLMFKPQLGVAVGVVFLAMRSWKIILGATLSAAVQVLAAWAYYGWGPIRDWMRTVLGVFDSLSVLEPKLYQTHSLRTFWNLLLIPSHISLALYVISASLVLVGMVMAWRSRLPLPVRYSALLLATVLVSPHLIVYDMVILAPAFLLLADWLMAWPQDVFGRRMAFILYFAYLSPLLGPLSQWVRLQLSVVLMTAAVFMIWHAGRQIDFISGSKLSLGNASLQASG